MSANFTCINGTNYNCTSKDCTPCEVADSPFSVFSKIRIIIYVIAFVLSVVGNGSVMLVTLKKIRAKTQVSAFSALLTHLAFVDFLFSCNAFILIPNEIHNEEHENGKPLCSFKKLFRQTPFMAATGTITVIAIERYRGITSHISRKWTHRRVFLSLLVVWIFSIAIYIPGIYVIKVKASGVDCYEGWSIASQRINNVFILLAEYVVPLIILGFCNYKIIVCIRGRQKFNLGRGNSNARQREQQDRELKKSARILVAIVLGFAIICLPNQIYAFYVKFSVDGEPTGNTWDILQMFGVLLLLHTSFNPAVYSIMDKNFRKEAKMVCCHCCPGDMLRKSSTSTKSSSDGKQPREGTGRKAIPQEEVKMQHVKAGSVERNAFVDN